MTFCVTLCVNQVRDLILAAGGSIKVGTRLKTYWWDLCEELVIHADIRVEPRTLERAWREGVLSHRVREALEKLADQKLKKAAKEHDLQFIADCKQWIERETADRTSIYPKDELAVAGAFISFLDRAAFVRRQVDDLQRRIARAQGTIEVARAALDEETREGKTKRRRG